jgi:hypothetical protein
MAASASSVPEQTHWQHFAGEPTTADAAGPYSREQLLRMDNDFIVAVEAAFQTAVWHSDAARGPSTPSFDHLVGAGDMPPEVRVELARLMPCSVTCREISRDDEIECRAKDTVTQRNVC